MRFAWPSMLALIVLSGCGTTPAEAPVAAKTTEPPVAETPKAPEPPKAAPGKPGPIQAGDEVAILDTDKGRIVFRFFPTKAPGHVANFKKIAEEGMYDGTYFHRVIPGFMIQGGDPNTKNEDRGDDGQGGPGWNITAEFNDVPHTRGIVSMARSQSPDSAGSQFFICVARAASLDGQYSVFGEVISGMKVVDQIVGAPRDARDNPEKPIHLKKVSFAKWPVPGVKVEPNE